jgi:hypothetical protein
MNRLLKFIAGLALLALETPMASRPNREGQAKAEALMKIADLHVQRFHKSRDMQWRVNVSVWVIAALAGIYFLERVSGSFVLLPRYSVYAFSALLAVGHFWWLYSLYKGQALDNSAYLKCREQALRHIDSLEEIGRSDPGFDKSGRFDVCAATAVTLLLSGTLSFLVITKGEMAAEEARWRPAVIGERVAEYQISANLYLDDICPLKLLPAESLLGSSAITIE